MLKNSYLLAYNVRYKMAYDGLNARILLIYSLIYRSYTFLILFHSSIKP